MTRLIVATAILLCSVPISATAQEPKSSVMSSRADEEWIHVWGMGDAQQNMYDYKVRREELAAVPDWLPDKSNPPLSVPDALAIARRTAHKDFPQFTDFMLTSIMLNPVPSYTSKLENRWFYAVDLYPELDGRPQVEGPVTVVILMNGTVLKPVLRTKDR